VLPAKFDYTAGNSWSPPRRDLVVPLRIEISRILGASARNLGKTDQAKALFEHFLSLLSRLDVKLELPVHRRVVAAALVQYVYDWNGFCDWRETRNLLASILADLRPVVARRLMAHEQQRTGLIEKLESLRRRELYSNLSKDIDGFIAKLRAGDENSLVDCKHFASWLRGQSDFRIGSTAAVFVEIPGVWSHAIGGKRHPRENEAATHLELLLPLLLRMIYGSSRSALSDADRIVSRALENVPHAIPTFEALRAKRWRKIELASTLASELGRNSVWLTLEELAQNLEQPAA
jgi:hypothetical protein